MQLNESDISGKEHIARGVATIAVGAGVPTIIQLIPIAFGYIALGPAFTLLPIISLISGVIEIREGIKKKNNEINRYSFSSY